MTIASICFIVAVILCALACFRVGSPRFNLGWGGVAFLTLGLLLSGGVIH